jgi:circadian clock protein KaiC
VSSPALKRLTTGSAAFDRILDGGIPIRSVNVIAGAPGAGKTLFSLQMLFALARQGKKGLYLTTLSEPSLKLVQYMQQFSFFDAALMAREVVFADLGAAIRCRRSRVAWSAKSPRSWSSIASRRSGT